MKRGLTTLELLLSIGVIALILSVSIPFYFSFFVSSKSESLAEELTTSVYRAKLKAVAAENDDNWGLAVNKDNKITIFRGNNYSARNIIYDESFDIEPGIHFTAETEIVFTKFSGLPDSTKSIVFSDTNGETRTINIDNYGNSKIEL